VKKDIDRMFTTGLIFLVDKAKWISPIMIQTKKGMDDIQVCVDYRILNIACVHDPFPTPFSDEVLDQLARNEAYSFTDGFCRYHQVRTVKEDKMKITFTIEWGSFAYNVLPFRLKHAPNNIFSDHDHNIPQFH
jgi:hypothetical protein